MFEQQQPVSEISSLDDHRFVTVSLGTITTTVGIGSAPLTPNHTPKVEMVINITHA
jgi:hypothetical protein